MNADQDLRTMLRERANDVSATASIPNRTVRRARVRKSTMAGGALAIVAVIAVAGTFALRSAVSTDAAPLPPAETDDQEKTKSSGGMWPQSNLEEVERAQRLADQGDSRYTWQAFSDWPPYPNMDPADAEIFNRFLQEKLGWEKFSWDVGPTKYPPEDWPWKFVAVRCAVGETNALYPDDPDGQECAPTLEENRYETVQINADQPVRDSTGEVTASGIWVVTGWRMLEPSISPNTSIDSFYQNEIQQVEPPSEVEATGLLTDFLQSRVDGEGAEEYMRALPEGEVPLLYATSSGARYERFEFDLVEGPVWPSGWMEFDVRLFAEDGTVVEQTFLLDREGDEDFVLVYRSLEETDVETMEDGESAAEAFEFIEGEMTFYANDRWEESFFYWGLGLDGDWDLRVEFAGNPRPVGPRCRPGPLPVDAEALADAIRSDPDLIATAPVPVTVGGLDGLQLDVTTSQGAERCRENQLPEVLSENDPAWIGLAPKPGIRERLYLLDLPEEFSALTMAIAVTAPEDRFDTLLEAAEPVVDSIEFNAP